MRTLATLLGLPRIDLARLSAALFMLLVAVALAVMGAVRVVDALQIGFLTVVHPALAALFTGLITLGVAFALVGASRTYLRHRRKPKPETAAAAAAGAEMVAQIFDIVRKNPGRAAAAAAALGFLVGSNPGARKTLNDMLGGDEGGPKAKTPPRD